MSENNPIRVFVSHVFMQSDDYLRVFEYLESVDRFYYINVSNPDLVPDGGAEGFKDALRAQIQDSEAVIVLASTYQQKRDWVDYQINAAKALEKPVILINAFGRVTVTPGDLVSRADEVLDWNEREIVDALKRLARGEDTQRWEVIDFP
ncbi:MAG: TIR domain-containing protein [Pseudomonadota bacterium]